MAGFFSLIVPVFLAVVCYSQARTIISGLSESSSEVTISGIQFSEMELYELKSDVSLQNLEYVIFEVHVSDSDMQLMKGRSSILPILCYDINQDPLVTYNSQLNVIVPCEQGFSYNQYSRGNGKYSVDVTTVIGQYSQIVFGFFVSGFTISYEVTVRGKFKSFKEDICAFNCSQSSADKAVCLNRTCNCNSDRIDYDCSVEAHQIVDNKMKLNLQQNKFLYVYYTPTEYDSISSSSSTFENVSIGFDLNKGCPPVSLYLSTWDMNPNKIVPDESNYSREFTIGEKELIITMKPTAIFDSNNHPTRVVFGLLVAPSQNHQFNNNVVVSLKGNPGEGGLNSSIIIIYILVTIVILLFLAWIGVMIVKTILSRNQRVHSLVMGNAPERRANKKEKGNQITVEILDIYMPVRLFEDIQEKEKEKGKTVSDSCSVCLGEFEANEQCRVALCAHVFHKDCLEQWFKKQENCPFCRADHSLEAIKKDKQIGADQEKKDIPAVENLLKANQNVNEEQDAQGRVGPNSSPVTNRVVFSSFQLNVQNQDSRNQNLAVIQNDEVLRRMIIAAGTPVESIDLISRQEINDATKPQINFQSRDVTPASISYFEDQQGMGRLNINTFPLERNHCGESQNQNSS